MLRCVDNRPMPTTTPDLPPADDEDTPGSPRGIQSVEVAPVAEGAGAHRPAHGAQGPGPRSGHDGRQGTSVPVSFGKLGLIEQDAAAATTAWAPWPCNWA